MRLEISTKNIQLTDDLRALIEKKMRKLDRFFSDDTIATIRLTVDKNREICEVTIPYTNGVFIRAKEVTNDIHTSIDGVIEKLEKQVMRQRTKIEKRYRSASTQPAIPVQPEDMDYPELAVVRTKTFPLKPMDIEEAIMQMDLLDHSFFVFRNAEDGQVNVLYLRDDGQLGLIQPDYA